MQCVIGPSVVQAAQGGAAPPQTVSARIQQDIAFCFEQGLGQARDHHHVLARWVDQSKRANNRMQPVVLPVAHLNYLYALRQLTGFPVNRLAYALCEWAARLRATPPSSDSGAGAGPAATPQGPTQAFKDMIATTTRLREHQRTAVTQAIEAMAQGKIVALDASTGSGKSRILAYVAAYAAHAPAAPMPRFPVIWRPSPQTGNDTPAVTPSKRADYIEELIRKARALHATRVQERLDAGQGHGPVLLAAPSVANVMHLMREFQQCSDDLSPTRRPLRCAALFGRAQFVDEDRLDWVLLALAAADEVEPDGAAHAAGASPVLTAPQREQLQRLQQWLREGMPAAPGDAVRVPGLVARAHEIAGDLVEALHDIALTESSTPEATQRYEEHRVAAQTAHVLFTTHASLCVDSRRLASQDKPPVLPPIKALCIDEAHLLESVQTSIDGGSLSFMLTIHAARQSLGIAGMATAQDKLVTALTQAEQALRQLPEDTIVPNDSPEWQEARQALGKAKTALASVVGKADTKDTSHLIAEQRASLQVLRRAQQVLERLANGTNKAIVAPSAIKKRMTLVAGSLSAEPALATRWSVTPSVMLASGTLMTSTHTGRNTRELVRSLAIDDQRLYLADDVTLGWLYTTPVLHLPQRHTADLLTPPQFMERESEEGVARRKTWVAAQAQAIARAAETAAGGMLVLCTGHDRLQELHEALTQEHGASLRNRLIRSSRDLTTAALDAAFRSMHAQRLRPVWLATGAAWVGLDLVDSDVPAAQDFLLTDLVITAAPYNIDQSLAARQRRLRVGFTAEQAAVWRRLQQGMGRLIRREGVLKRRLWILDGRLVDAASANYTRDLRALLARYVHVKRFRIN